MPVHRCKHYECVAAVHVKAICRLAYVRCNNLFFQPVTAQPCPAAVTGGGLEEDEAPADPEVKAEKRRIWPTSLTIFSFKEGGWGWVCRAVEVWGVHGLLLLLYWLARDAKRCPTCRKSCCFHVFGQHATRRADMRVGRPRCKNYFCTKGTHPCMWAYYLTILRICYFATLLSYFFAI